jgi:hypothetical protein
MTELKGSYYHTDDTPSDVADPSTLRELVGDALDELEARGVRWSEILNVLTDVAQLRGQHELAQILGSATYEVSRLEPKDEV